MVTIASLMDDALATENRLLEEKYQLCEEIGRLKAKVAWLNQQVSSQVKANQELRSEVFRLKQALDDQHRRVTGDNIYSMPGVRENVWTAQDNSNHGR